MKMLNSTIEKFQSTAARALFAGLLVALLWGGSEAQAASTANTTLKVTVGVNLSVAIGSATYDFGALGTNQAAISTGAIPVTNDSAGLTEDFQIYGSSTASWNPGVSTNTVENTFNLRVLISTQASPAPAYNDFATTNTGLLNGPENAVNMSAANVGWYASGHANNMIAGTTKYLWFRLITPASISAGNNVQQSMTVTVVAANSSTF